MTAKKALESLIADPLSFLKNYPLSIDARGATGSAKEKSGKVVPAYFARNVLYRPGTFWGKLRMHEVDTFRISFSQPQAAHGEKTAPDFTTFNAAYAAIQWSDAEPDWIALGDASILLTGQFTGCSFVVRQEGKELQAAHIQPTGGRPGGGKTGVELNDDLKKDHKDWTVFGKRDYEEDDSAVTVIGVKASKGWKIYSQKRTRFATPPKIASVQQVYPAP